MRRFPAMVALVLFAGFAAAWAGSTPPGRAGDDDTGKSLLQMLAEWKYPGSAMLGATMSDGGNPRIQSVKCQAVLTTADPFDEVVAYYEKTLGTAPDAEPRAKDDLDAGSVDTVDDSEGRALALRVFVVHRESTSTTLVVSRAEGEAKTHVAWSHYLRLGEKP